MVQVGAWWLRGCLWVFGWGPRILQGWQVTDVCVQVVSVNLMLNLVQAARGGSCGIFAIFVKYAPVAGAHEQARLGKPAHRAAEMCAVHGENFKTLFRVPPHIDAQFSGNSIPRATEWIFQGHKARFIFFKVLLSIFLCSLDGRK